MPAGPAPDVGTTPPFHLGRHRALDGLRALAMLAVVGRHLNQHDLVRGGGALGVGMFFALSGFLMTAALVAERDATGGNAPLAMVRSRVLRIVPALVVCVALLGAYDLREPGFVDWREVTAALTFTANWAMITGEPIGPVTHTWYLAALVQLTVAWFVGFVLLARLSRSRAQVALGAAGLVVASWGWRCWLLASDVTFERMRAAPDARADALLLGAVAALLVAHRRPRVPSWLVVVAAASLLWQLTVPPADEVTIVLGWTLVPAATAVLAVAAVTGPGTWTTRLSWPPLLWVGLISYSLYLWHFPLYRILDVELGLTGWVRTAVLVVASIGVGAVSHRLVEVPTGRWLAGRRDARPVSGGGGG